MDSFVTKSLQTRQKCFNFFLFLRLFPSSFSFLSVLIKSFPIPATIYKSFFSFFHLRSRLFLQSLFLWHYWKVHVSHLHVRKKGMIRDHRHITATFHSLSGLLNTWYPRIALKRKQGDHVIFMSQYVRENCEATHTMCRCCAVTWEVCHAPWSEPNQRSYTWCAGVAVMGCTTSLGLAVSGVRSLHVLRFLQIQRGNSFIGCLVVWYMISINLNFLSKNNNNGK